MKNNLIFLHQPKAAGSTLKQVMRRQLPAAKMLIIDGKRSDEIINNLKEFSIEDKSRLRLIFGHVFYGLHEYFDQDFRYATFLRHPVGRINSHYRYVKSKGSHPLHKIVNGGNMSLYDYATSELTNELENDQARRIAGDAYKNSNNAKEIYEAAISNVEKHFAFIGTQENFNASLLGLSKVFGFKKVFYVPKNITKVRPSLNIDLDAVDAIRQRNTADIKLYNQYYQQYEPRFTGSMLCLHFKNFLYRVYKVGA